MTQQTFQENLFERGSSGAISFMRPEAFLVSKEIVKSWKLETTIDLEIKKYF